MRGLTDRDYLHPHQTLPKLGFSHSATLTARITCGITDCLPYQGAALGSRVLAGCENEHTQCAAYLPAEISR